MKDTWKDYNQITIISKDAMRMYKIDYRDDNDSSYFFTQAKDAEDAAFQALDWTKAHRYKLLDVKEIFFV